jgi:hypothetical protein
MAQAQSIDADKRTLCRRERIPEPTEVGVLQRGVRLEANIARNRYRISEHEIPWNLEMDRARLGASGRGEAVRQQFCQLRQRSWSHAQLRQRLKHVHGVVFVIHPVERASRRVEGQTAGDMNGRAVARVGLPDACQGIQKPRSGGAEADARLARQTAVGICHQRCVAFMPGGYVPDFRRRPEPVVNLDDMRPDQAEGGGDSFRLHGGYGHVGGRCLSHRRKLGNFDFASVFHAVDSRQK